MFHTDFDVEIIIVYKTYHYSLFQSFLVRTLSVYICLGFNLYVDNNWNSRYYTIQCWYLQMLRLEVL